MLTHTLQMLKTHTREVLYERFRTEKLLVRRATQKIGEKEAKRLFDGASSPFRSRCNAADD